MEGVKVNNYSLSSRYSKHSIQTIVVAGDLSVHLYGHQTRVWSVIHPRSKVHVHALPSMPLPLAAAVNKLAVATLYYGVHTYGVCYSASLN
jgi:hypothetical protein